MGRSLSKEIDSLVSMKMDKLKETVKLRDPLHLVILYIPGEIGSRTESSRSNPYINGIKRDCERVGIDYTVKTVECKASLLAECHSCFDSKRNATVVVYPSNPIIEKYEIKSAISRGLPPYHDIDGALGVNSYYTSPTALAIADFIQYIAPSNVLRDMNISIINRSDHIGKPLANLLLAKDANPTILHSKSSIQNIIRSCKSADVIVTATGNYDLIDIDFINHINRDLHKTIVDVGCVIDSNGNFCGGDIPSSLYQILDTEKINIDYTPYIGGIGKITRMCLLENLVNGYTLNG